MNCHTNLQTKYALTYKWETGFEKNQVTEELIITINTYLYSSFLYRVTISPTRFYPPHWDLWLAVHSQEYVLPCVL